MKKQSVTILDQQNNEVELEVLHEIPNIKGFVKGKHYGVLLGEPVAFAGTRRWVEFQEAIERLGKSKPVGFGGVVIDDYTYAIFKIDNEVSEEDVLSFIQTVYRTIEDDEAAHDVECGYEICE